jgi:hypothetical protein
MICIEAEIFIRSDSLKYRSRLFLSTNTLQGL